MTDSSGETVRKLPLIEEAITRMQLLLIQPTQQAL